MGVKKLIILNILINIGLGGYSQDYIDLYDDILYNNILGVKIPKANREYINTAKISTSDFIKSQKKYLNKAYIDTIRVNGKISAVKKFDNQGLCFESIIFRSDTFYFRKRVFYSNLKKLFSENVDKLYKSPHTYYSEYVLLTDKNNKKISVSYSPTNNLSHFSYEEFFYNKNETRIDSIWGSSGNTMFFYSKKNRLKKVFINSGEHIIYTKYNKEQLTEIILYEIKSLWDYSPEFYYPAKRISDFFPIRYEIDDLIPTSFIKELLNQNFKKKNQIPFFSFAK